MSADKLLRPIGLTSLLVAMALLMGACDKKPSPPVGGPTSPTAQRVKIGFLVKQPDEPWFQMEWKFAREAEAKYGFELMEIGVPGTSN